MSLSPVVWKNGSLDPQLNISQLELCQFFFPAVTVLAGFQLLFCKAYELSPKFNCCKMEYLFILRFKGPLRFSMFGTRLSFKQFWLCLFLNGLRDFGCRAPFWKPCTFACGPARLYSICLRPSVAARISSRWKGLHVSTSGWTVCLILRLTRDCIFFPGKAHAANSRSASSSLVRMDWF